MGRGRLITVFAAASAVLMFSLILLSAAAGGRLGNMFGGVFAPIFAYQPPVVSVDGKKYYRRDVQMLRLTADLNGLSDGNSTGAEYTDEEALSALVDQLLLADSATENGVSPDPTSLSAALEPLYNALATEAGGALRDAYKNEFARSDKAFDADLKGAVNRALTVKVFLTSLYYTAVAQGAVSPELDEEQVIHTLREKLLIKLHIEKDIKIF